MSDGVLYFKRGAPKVAVKMAMLALMQRRGIYGEEVRVSAQALKELIKFAVREKK